MVYKDVTWEEKSIPKIDLEPSMESRRPYPVNVNVSSWNQLYSRILPPPSQESIPQRNWFSQGIDSVESRPGVLKSLTVRSLCTVCPNVLYRDGMGILDSRVGNCMSSTTWVRTVVWVKTCVPAAGDDNRLQLRSPCWSIHDRMPILTSITVQITPKEKASAEPHCRSHPPCPQGCSSSAPSQYHSFSGSVLNFISLTSVPTTSSRQAESTRSIPRVQRWIREIPDRAELHLKRIFNLAASRTPVMATLGLGCPRNSVDTEFRWFFLLPSIPYSVRNWQKFRRNSAEFRVG